MEAIRQLTKEQKSELLFEWGFWSRENQRAPLGNWRTWLILAGRGWGKTRTGAEWIRQRASSLSCRRIHLVAATAADARDTMVEGPAGILACCPPSYLPIYEPSKRRLTWPSRRDVGGSDVPGPIATTFSADEPDRLRGPQCDTAWGDELAAWQYAEAWDQLQMGLRLGNDPRSIVTTTPRPTPIIRELVKDPSTFVTRGSTYDNKGNLARAFIERMQKKYEGTRLGRQELFAEILDDAPGALWKRDQLDALRVSQLPYEFKQVIIGVDPAVADLTARKDLDREKLAETGIVTVGLGPKNHGYVIRDDSGHYTPNEWAQKVIKVFDITKANYIVAEANNGGALVKSNLQTVRPSLPVQLVYAARGKLTRAEPVGAVYEQSRVHHLGLHAKLEDQMCTWEPELGMKSPDRLDALVWALTFLMVDGNMDLVTKKPDPVTAVLLDNISVFG